MDKIRAIKKMCQERGVNPWIEVDGGVTPANAYKVIEAGANALVAGSAVYGSKDYAAGERLPALRAAPVRLRSACLSGCCECLLLQRHVLMY